MNGSYPGAAARLLLLLRLRFKLVFRGPGRGALRRVLLVFALAQIAAFGGIIGYGCYRIARDASDPAELRSIVHALFFGVFLLQLGSGVIGASLGEFFDTSRLSHLPAGPREIFAAMTTSSMLSPALGLVFAPIAGVGFAMGGRPGEVAARVAAALLLVLFTQAASLGIGFAFLAISSRRRLRDVSTAVGGVLALCIFGAFRAFWSKDLSTTTALLKHPAWIKLLPLPSQWFAQAFCDAGAAPAASAGWLLAGTLAVAAAALAGSRAFRAVYDAAGDGGGGAETVKEIGGALSRYLPSDVSAVMRQTLAVTRREPQLRLILLQQFVFLAGPIIFQSSSKGRFDGFPWLVPVMLAMSHAALAFSVFGIDGRGLRLLLQSPMGRARLVASRAGALLVLFCGFDVVGGPAIAAALCGLSHDWAPWPTQAALITSATILMDAVLLAAGGSISVLAPLPVVRARRGAQTRTGSREGCVTMLGRMVVLAPVAILAAGVASLAAAPRIFGLGTEWYAASVPAAVVATGALFMLGASVAGRLLETREEKLMRALADVGD